jgi:alpha-L-arabinofuranosidase
MGIKSASGKLLTGSVHTHNTFEKPDNVKITELNVKTDGDKVLLSLPPNSVARIELI